MNKENVERRLKDSTKQTFDFCNIWSQREIILKKTELPLFSSWWKSFVESQQTLEPSNNPIEQIESIAFAYAISGDEALGQKALNSLRKELPTYIPSTSIIHKEMYPEVEADLTVASACKKLAYTYNFLHPLLLLIVHQMLMPLPYPPRHHPYHLLL